MDIRQLQQFLYLPYQFVRVPLGMVDERAVRRLPPTNPLRVGFEAGLRFSDTAVAMLLDVPGLVGADGLTRDGATRSAFDDVADDDIADDDVADFADDADGLAVADELAPAADDPALALADEQRRAAERAEEERITRGNRSPTTVARELAQARAAARAREDEAHARHQPG